MNQSSIIKQLRIDGRNPEFCKKITYKEFDKIIHLLYNRSEPIVYFETIDLLATISNILLVNRELHTLYFTKTYSNDILQYLDGLIQSRIALGARPEKDYDFTSLIPIYRLIFLILYDGLNNVNDDLVHNIYSLLIRGFKFCDGLFTNFKSHEHYKMTFIEILKSLYTLNHKYKYGGELIKNEHLSLNVILTINEMFDYKPNPITLTHTGRLLIKNLLNFLLGLFTVDSSIPTIYSLDINFDHYNKFFNNLLTLLKFQLQNYLHEIDHASEFELSDLNNLLVVINFIHQQVTNQFSNNSSYLLNLHLVLKNGFFPNENSSYIYNKLISLINLSNKSSISTSDSFFNSKNTDLDITQLSYSKNIILQLFYNLSFNDDKEIQLTDFLNLMGYLNSEPFIRNNEISLPSQIDLEKYLYPSSDYLDSSNDADSNISKGESAISSIFNQPRFSRNNSFTSNQSIQPNDDLTETEKEIEAEKLFNIFDRMEKIGVFQNFKNPVREWQQLGRFENLPNDDNDD